jgi:hypothetical protein
VRLRLTISGRATYVNKLRRSKALGQQEKVASEGFGGRGERLGSLETRLGQSSVNVQKPRENQQKLRGGALVYLK